MFEIIWSEFDRRNRLVTKRRSFETEQERQCFTEKLAEKESFFAFVAWSK